MAGQCYKGLRFKVIGVTRVALQSKNWTYHLNGHQGALQS